MEPFSVTVGADGDTVGTWDRERSTDTIGDDAAGADDEDPSPSRGPWSNDHSGHESEDTSPQEVLSVAAGQDSASFSLAETTTSAEGESVNAYGSGVRDAFYSPDIMAEGFFRGHLASAWTDFTSGVGSDLPVGYWPRVEVVGHDAARARDQSPSPSLNHEGQRADSTPLAQAGDGAGGGTSPGTFSLTTETVTSPGSGLVFVNKYGSGVTDAFHSCIIAAEHFFQSNFTNACTLDVSFDLKALSGFKAYNTFSFVHVSYATLKNALATHDTTSAEQLAAVASLPATDPSHGAGFNLPVGYADMLGLSSASGTDSVVLSSSVGWNYGQDAIGAIEHEISEGAMGRLGGLGVQNRSWSTMDLFRYAAAGVHDYTGGKDGLATYFSGDGTDMQLPFHNSVSTTGAFDGYDFADWDFSVAGDAFGSAGPSSPGYISETDLQVMNVLGWIYGLATKLSALPRPTRLTPRIARWVRSSRRTQPIPSMGWPAMITSVALAATTLSMAAPAPTTCWAGLATTPTWSTMPAMWSTRPVASGIDTVQSSISFSLADPVHAIGDIENLTLTGTAAINATGNALDNVLIGNSGANVLTGLDGNDTLNGGGGADHLFGGTGNDTYVVDNAGDIVDETGGSGIDTVQSSVSFSLADPVHAIGDIENLTLTGTANINATGNALDNVLIGNSGNNVLIGGAGADTLDGGGGTDTASYASSLAGVTVSLMTGSGSGGDAQGDTLTNIENLTGSNFDDTLEGNSLNNVLVGGLGTDTVSYANALSGANGVGVTVNLALTPHRTRSQRVPTR